MQVKIIALSIIVMLMAGCNEFKKSKGDLFYKIIEDVAGPTIREGDFASITFTEKTEEGKLLAGSYLLDRPILMCRERAYFQGDFFTALGLLSEGDSAIFKINIDSIIKKTGRVKPAGTYGKYLIYTIKVNKVIARETLNDDMYNSKLKAFERADNERARISEAGKINKYISFKKIKPQISSSGLRYIITQKGRGKQAIIGDTVVVNYSGSYLSGKVFETTLANVSQRAEIYNKLRPYSPIKFGLATGAGKSGFEEALLSFPEGTKVTLIIPSKLAYGQYGYRSVPPYMPIICDLEIIKVIHAGKKYK